MRVRVYLKCSSFKSRNMSRWSLTPFPFLVISKTTSPFLFGIPRCSWFWCWPSLFSFKSWKYLETLLLKDGVFDKGKMLLINRTCIWIIWSEQYVLLIVHIPMFLSLEVHGFLVRSLMVLVIIFCFVHQLMRAGIK